MLTDVEVAWLAGLLEGEGCFSLAYTGPVSAAEGRRPALRVSVKMTDRDVIERAGRMIYMVTGKLPAVAKRVDKRENAADCYEIIASGVNAERVMRVLQPYMGQRRRAKIATLLSTPNLSHTPRPKV
jgi:hypothetical protein